MTTPEGPAGGPPTADLPDVDLRDVDLAHAELAAADELADAVVGAAGQAAAGGPDSHDTKPETVNEATFDGRCRVLVTGAATFVGGYVTRRLARDPRVDRVVAVDALPPSKDMLRRMDPAVFVRTDYRSNRLSRLMREHGITHVVHALPSIADERGATAGTKDSIVFGSMQVFAACQKVESVRRVVMRSTSSVYGSGPRFPALLTESFNGRSRLSGHAQDIADAELYARSMARRRPDLDLVILRLAPIIGPNINSAMGRYLSSGVIPSILGQDARLQLLHQTDAIGAIKLAVLGPETDAPGTTAAQAAGAAGAAGVPSTAQGSIVTINVAGDGVVFTSQAIAIMGAVRLPVIRPAFTLAASMVRGARVAGVGEHELDYLTWGTVLDTTRMTERLGFTPKYSTRAALEDVRDSLSGERLVSADSVAQVELAAVSAARRLLSVGASRVIGTGLGGGESTSARTGSREKTDTGAGLTTL